MKTLFIVILTLSQSVIASDGAALNIFHSEPASYVHFLRAGFDEARSSGSMKEAIAQNNIEGFETKRNKEDYRLLKSYLSDGYNFKGLATRPSGFYGEDAFIMMSAMSETLGDFENLLSILMPYQGVSVYFRLKKVFYQDFFKKFWEPTLILQSKELTQLKRAIKTSRFTHHLNSVKTFYNSAYPKELAFEVALVPIKNEWLKNTNTSAQNLGNIQVVPYIASRGSKDNLDVIFHELCHALYEGQSKEVQVAIEKFYLNSEHPHAKFVYAYLNEALATALGNGYYKEIESGRLAKGAWYSDKYIDLLAKAYLPLIRKYLNNRKAIDASFMQHTLRVAEQVLPDAPFKLDANVLSVKILVDHSKINENTGANLISSNFRVHSLSSISPIKKEDWQRVNSNDVASTFIISETPQLVQLQLKNLLTAKNLELLKASQQFVVTLKHKGRFIFWFNVKGSAGLEKGIRRLKKLVKLSTDFSLSPIM